MKKITGLLETGLMIFTLLFCLRGAKHHIFFLKATMQSTSAMMASLKDTTQNLNAFSKEVSLQSQLDALKSLNKKLFSIENALQKTKKTLPGVLTAEATTLHKLQKQNMALARLNGSLEPLSGHLLEGVTETKKLQGSMGGLTGTLKKLSSLLSEMSTTMDEFYKIIP